MGKDIYKDIKEGINNIIPNLEFISYNDSTKDELEAGGMEGKNIVCFLVQYNQGGEISNNTFYIYVKIENNRTYKIIGMSERE